MHDCQETKERLLDLIFGETKRDERERALSEIERCSSCDAEYRSLASTLFVYDRATLGAQPNESFWRAHHERLRERLEAAPVTASPVETLRAAPAWKRIFAAQFNVPAPLAAAALILLATTTLLALRAPRSVTSVAPVQTIVERRTVEVAVPQERVVTKIVYVDRGRRAVALPTRQTARNSPLNPQMALVRPNLSANSPEALQGFKPAESVNLHIIKGSFPR